MVQTDGSTNKEVDRHRQTDSQTDRHTEIYTDIHTDTDRQDRQAQINEYIGQQFDTRWQN